MNLTYKAFVNKYLGKKTDYDGVYGSQCVDLIKVYLKDCFDISAGSWGNAVDYYRNFNNPSWAGYSVMNKYFTRISNSATFIPLEGDICIFGERFSKSHDYGHIGISTNESTLTKVFMYDQNATGNKDAMKKSTYGYISKNFLGVLRPKDRSFITGSKYETGKYEVVEDVNVRKGAGINFNRVYYSQFTANAKAQVKKLDKSCPDYFPAGVKLTISKVDGTWGKCPSGWISLNLCKKVK